MDFMSVFRYFLFTALFYFFPAFLLFLWNHIYHEFSDSNNNRITDKNMWKIRLQNKVEIAKSTYYFIFDVIDKPIRIHDNTHPTNLLKFFFYKPVNYIINKYSPSQNSLPFIPIGYHVKLIADTDSPPCSNNNQTLNSNSNTVCPDRISRNYTPVLYSEKEKKIGFIVKIYKPFPPTHPKGGLFTQWLNTVQINDILDMREAYGNVFIDEVGSLTYLNKKYKYRRLGMIAGGTGITPFLRIIDFILNSKLNIIPIHLLYASHSEEDIIYKNELDTFQKLYPDIFKVDYIISQSNTPDWNHLVGRIDTELLKNKFLSYNENSLVLLCGRPFMVRNTCIPGLLDAGWPSDSILIF